jgi:predicted ATPase
VAFLQGDTWAVSRQACAPSIGGFHDKRLEEYRDRLSARTTSEIIYHGVVWPLLGIEDETTDVAAEIEAALRKSGLKEVVVLDQQFPYEFCDDCGAPLYPNIEGDTVHAEMPEQNNAPSQTLH